MSWKYLLLEVEEARAPVLRCGRRRWSSLDRSDEQKLSKKLQTFSSTNFIVEPIVWLFQNSLVKTIV